MTEEHFIFSPLPRFKPGDTVRPVRDNGVLVGLDIVDMGGVARDAPGRVLDKPPTDPRCDMRVSINGVHLYMERI